MALLQGVGEVRTAFDHDSDPKDGYPPDRDKRLDSDDGLNEDRRQARDDTEGAIDRDFLRLRDDILRDTAARRGRRGVKSSEEFENRTRPAQQAIADAGPDGQGCCISLC